MYRAAGNWSGLEWAWRTEIRPTGLFTRLAGVTALAIGKVTKSDMQAA